MNIVHSVTNKVKLKLELHVALEHYDLKEIHQGKKETSIISSFRNPFHLMSYSMYDKICCQKTS